MLTFLLCVLVGAVTAGLIYSIEQLSKRRAEAIAVKKPKRKSAKSSTIRESKTESVKPSYPVNFVKQPPVIVKNKRGRIRVIDPDACKTSGKICHESKEAAMVALESAREAQKDKDKQVCRAYFHETCKTWHLTSWSQDQYRRRVDK